MLKKYDLQGPSFEETNIRHMIPLMFSSATVTLVSGIGYIPISSSRHK